MEYELYLTAIEIVINDEIAVSEILLHIDDEVDEVWNDLLYDISVEIDEADDDEVVIIALDDVDVNDNEIIDELEPKQLHLDDEEVDIVLPD